MSETAEPADVSLRDHARAVLSQAWDSFQPLPALYCVPGVALALLVGLWFRQPGIALLTAAGAFSAGFGAFQQLTRHHVAPMLLAAACMAVATAVGTVASGDWLVDGVVVSVAAFALGLIGAFGTGPWWVLLQGAVFLVIAAAHPGDWTDGGARGLLVLAGGVLETVIVALLRWILPLGFPVLTAPNTVLPPASWHAWLVEGRRVLTPLAPEFRFALVLGLAAGAAVLISRQVTLANGYWAPMTVLLVMRRGGAETFIRSVQRILGTLVGAVAATLVAWLLHPDHLVLLAVILVSAWAAFATQWVNYGTFSTSVTSYIAFLMALTGLPEGLVLIHRVEATLLGGAVGMVALALARLGRHARMQILRARV